MHKFENRKSRKIENWCEDSDSKRHIPNALLEYIPPYFSEVLQRNFRARITPLRLVGTTQLLFLKQDAICVDDLQLEN